MTSACRVAVGLASSFMVCVGFPRNLDWKTALCHRTRKMSSGLAGHVSVRLFGVDEPRRPLSHRERGFCCFFRRLFLIPLSLVPEPGWGTCGP